MPKKLRAMLPHAAILIANMYIVFFLIDRVNSAMNFIDNGLTKGLLLAMSLIVLADVLRRPFKGSGRCRFCYLYSGGAGNSGGAGSTQGEACRPG